MTRRAVAAAVLLCALTLRPAFAVVEHGLVWKATYVAAYQPTFGRQGVPYAGTLKLTFNRGIITGTYVSDSVRPDRLRGRIVAVSGNVSGGHITLIFQVPGGFTVRGTLAGDGEISGTATVEGRFYSFLAKVKSSP